MNKKNIKELLTQKIDIINELKKIGPKPIITYLCTILSFVIIYMFLNSVTEFKVSSQLFNIFWIMLIIITISISYHKRIVYLIPYYLFFLLSIVQYFHIIIVEKPFSLSQILYFKEGMTYTNSIFSNINIKVIIYIIFGIINSIICSNLIKKNLKEKNIKPTKIIIITCIALFLFITRGLLISMLSSGEKSTFFEANFSKNEIYTKFVDKELALNMTGIFEYSLREPFLYIKKNIEYNIKEGKKIVSTYFEENDNSFEKNEYSGIFKDKNVIFVMAESIDTWMIEENLMPTVYHMKNNSIDFTNRYSPWYGSGRTFNTEYCINTGLYVPIDYNIFSTRDNNYDYSLANMFKMNGYETSSIHFNDSEFYDRVNMHKSYGYENTYLLADMTNKYYKNDSDLVNEFYDLMISKENKFMTFFITYSAHLPYNGTNELCADLKTEDECVTRLVKYTDDAIKILIEKLENDNLLDDTVIVFITDHYAYDYNQTEIINKKGGNDNIHLDKVPFFIWSNDKYTQEINKYVDTQDILPTVLNLFGIEYNNVYIGTDALSNKHKNYVYFNNETYIGDVDNNIITNIKKEKEVNELIIKTDYYNGKSN